ncbi:hypothetical protein MN202_19135 [Rheinheimera muenzenbergensis]|uniref:Uncharacterized protein n=1 Tax=Rheinheimera muenzenbergensis TaxID=1193628 RepID=A0ABU8CCN9_9GAMM
MLQLCGIDAETQLMQFSNDEIVAYVRVNKGAADTTIFMIVGNSSNVYGLTDNFSSAFFTYSG